jgi:ABC exporter DevB family membrane fusion protein
MKKSHAIALGVLVASFMSFSVVRQVAAGRDTSPGPRDVATTSRTVAPKTGADERTSLVAGNFVAGNGVVEPADRETKVAPQIAGRVKTVFVKEGDVIEKGAPMAELENATEKAQLAAAEGDLAQAKAELTRTLRGMRKEDVDAVVGDAEAQRARTKLSADTLARTELLAKGGAATPDELDRARRQAEADARALDAQDARRKAAISGSRAEDITVSQAKVQATLARRDQARAQLERLTITAPIAGEILQVKTHAGEYATPTGDPLVVMGDTSKLRVRVDVDERDIGKVKLGARAFAVQSAFPDKRVGGRVVEVGRRMGRKNVRTDDPTERIDTKILETVIELDDKSEMVPGLRVVGYVEVL